MHSCISLLLCGIKANLGVSLYYEFDGRFHRVNLKHQPALPSLPLRKSEDVNGENVSVLMVAPLLLRPLTCGVHRFVLCPLHFTIHCLFFCCSRLEGGEDARVRSMLSKLEASFKWELRTLWVGLVFVIVYFFSQQAAYVFAGLIAASLIATDGAFSIVVTMIFIRPISLVLREGGCNVTRHSKRHRELQKTMYMTLFGSSLAVFSSTALYINMIVNAVQPKSLGSPWSHSLMFGMNLDSILNDVGMLFVCGALNGAKWKHVMDFMRRMPAGLKKKARYAIGPGRGEACALDSKAYDDSGDEKKSDSPIKCDDDDGEEQKSHSPINFSYEVQHN